MFYGQNELMKIFYGQIHSFNSLHWTCLASRRRLTYLIFHGIYILFVDFFWSWNTFWFFSSLFVGLSFIIFLIRFTNNFWFYFCHFEALLRQKIKTKEQRFCGINYFLAKNKHKMPKCCYILVKTGMGKSI